jgi:hypothetical protein
MPGLLRPLTVLVVACLAWSVLLAATAFAADQRGDGVTRQARTTRTTGPTPHLRVVCYDVQSRQIPCAYSADVAVQEAHRPYRQPYTLWPSRYSGPRSWWW